MARIRSVHPGLFTDESFMTASLAARILYIGLWTECDDQGIFEWKPITLKMRIFPVDDVKTEDLLAALAALDMIKKFEIDGRKFGAVRNFCKWQRPKAPQSVYECPGDMAEFTGLSHRIDRDNGRPERGTALGKLLCDQQEGRCFYCECEITFYRKKPNSLEIDHKIPVSRGGGDSIENLVASCRKCNSLKANLTDSEFSAKFAPAELRLRHSSQLPKDNSQSAKTISAKFRANSQIPKISSGEIPPLMEDGGWKDPSQEAETSQGRVLPLRGGLAG